MTLRLALLLVSLIVIGLIGLICHQKYRHLNPNKPLRGNTANVDSDSELEQDVSTPFFTENVISDIPEEALSVLQPAQLESKDNSQPPELKTSLEELMDQKQIVQQLAAELSPDHNTENIIIDHVAVLPNVNNKAKQVNKVVELLSDQVDKPVQVLVQIKGKDDFVPLSAVTSKSKIKHIKTVFQFKDKTGLVDDRMIGDYEQFVEKLAHQFDCEYRFSLTSKQALDARKDIEEFIKSNDLITILYILAQPDGSFSGTAMQNALIEAGLQHGEFNFFHYTSSSGKNQDGKIYSLTNMYKPGSFDLEILDQFTTMGLCAFMVPALLQDPISGFKEMCASCKQVADQLNGVLTTNQRELLNEENYLMIRNQINEHNNELQKRGISCGSEMAKQLFA